MSREPCDYPYCETPCVRPCDEVALLAPDRTVYMRVREGVVVPARRKMMMGGSLGRGDLEGSYHSLTHRHKRLIDATYTACDALN